MKKVAIIDMGTNTFHLMFAEVLEKGFKILSREKVPVKIGVGGINHGYITNEGADRAMKAMHAFAESIKRENASLARAIGTSAFRNAHNGPTIATELQKQTGIECEIISGIKEAEYIYKGVRAAIPLGNSPVLIVDIGGGSVEFIIGNESEIFWSHSFEIGGQRLLERFQKHDPILAEEVESLNKYFESELILLFEALEKFNPTMLAGSSGTFDTLSDIYCHQHNLPLHDLPETPFDISAFAGIHHEFLNKNRTERMKIPGMIELRVDMIVVACCLIDFLLKHHSFQQVRVSSYSLKEGVLAELASIK